MFSLGFELGCWVSILYASYPTTSLPQAEFSWFSRLRCYPRKWLILSAYMIFGCEGFLYQYIDPTPTLSFAGQRVSLIIDMVEFDTATLFRYNSLQASEFNAFKGNSSSSDGTGSFDSDDSYYDEDEEVELACFDDEEVAERNLARMTEMDTQN